MPWPKDQLHPQWTGQHWAMSPSFLLWVPSQFCHFSFPLLPFQIIKAYLDYSLYHQLAGYQGMWFKYEIMAMEQISSLPLKDSGIEIVSYVADKLGYTKLLMGHLDLAIDLGKFVWARRDMQIQVTP